MTRSPSEFAAALRAARKARGLSEMEAARNSFLSDNQIRGLETDDRSSFYTPYYAEKAATAYADYLGVPLSLAGAPPYTAQAATPAPTEQPAPPSLPPPPAATAADLEPLRKYLPAALLVLAVGLLGALYWLGGWDSQEPPPPTRAAALPAKPALPPAAPVAPAPAAAIPAAADAPSAELPAVDAAVDAPEEDKSLRFFLVVTAPARVEVTDSTGQKLLSGIQGVDLVGRRVYGTPPFQLETDNAESIAVYYLGNRIRPEEQRGGHQTAAFGAR